MNFNVWNIKEMLSIPSGSGITKPSNWNSNQTDCSSLSDSQFLFGSQFCPENSEILSTTLDVGAYSRHPKQTQQNSVDNEPSIFTKYQTKPQLFGGDTKDEGLFSLPLPVGKSKGLLKQFEEKKRRATDKCDSEMLYNFVSHFQEVIHKLQTSVEKSEEHLSSRSQSILDSLETIAKTIQETAQVQRDLMFEAVRDKGNMEQAILEIQKRFEARQAEFMEMKSNLKNLEVLVAQQSKDFQQLCEKLGQLNVPGVIGELGKLISAPQVAGRLKDSTSQTSPAQAQSLHFTRQEKYTSEEPAAQQAQVSLAGNPSKSSQRPREFGILDEVAESDDFGKAALPTDGPHRGNEHLKNKTMQTYCKNWVITTRSLSNHCSSLPSQKAGSDQELTAQEASQLDLNKFESRVKNVCPKYEVQSMCSDSFEQSATEQKGRTRGKGRKGKKQQLRKSQRGRLLARKREQTPRKACTFISKHASLQSPVSSPQGPLISWWAPRSSTKSARHSLGRRVRTSKTAREAHGGILQSTQRSSPDQECLSSSSQGDQQINWFSDLSLENPEPRLCRKGGKNLLFDPDFDSSDDNF
ncbi:interactor of HORMAD1 protein 1 [Onychomys torridus]|uniref:interactor of HORMAD1 protein 1 n=1 Tax=Onychomys torridus TaxID=38674 RepID=UPI00167F3DF2|nr:interactor of HORMAD1 protein 1 [Onychomys torridus]XP_036049572.1 interactor of HORMAD1 protein 1 [Onychomys torridus]